MHRRDMLTGALAVGLTAALPLRAGADGFGTWLARFQARARAAGISETVLRAAFAGAAYLPESVRSDRSQGEFTKSYADYFSTAVSDARVSNGRALVQRHAGVLNALGRSLGSDPYVVTAIWGMESNYGARRGDIPVFSTLATLAYDGRRGRFFEAQLMAALRILARGEAPAAAMVGSWAGAMGHTQFIPTSFEAYGIDATGDGRRDIWGEDPSDALGSTANYLRRMGYRGGAPWGQEVLLPRGFDYALSWQAQAATVAQWSALGLRPAEGGWRDGGSATLVTPTGAGGPAFLMFRNATAIARYNNAEAYVLAVGHLSDRLRGGGRLARPFPPETAQLRRAERVEVQRRLAAAGYPVGTPDGVIGPATRRAIRAWQSARGQVPDGYASAALLAALR